MQKTKSLTTKHMLLASLLAVILVLVGFLLDSPKATRAKALTSSATMILVPSNYEDINVVFDVFLYSGIVRYRVKIVPSGYSFVNIVNISSNPYQIELFDVIIPYGSGLTHDAATDLKVILEKHIDPVPPTPEPPIDPAPPIDPESPTEPESPTYPEPPTDPKLPNVSLTGMEKINAFFGNDRWIVWAILIAMGSLVVTFALLCKKK